MPVSSKIMPSSVEIQDRMNNVHKVFIWKNHFLKKSHLFFLFTALILFLETQDNPQGDPNLQLWDIQTGKCIKAFYQKKVQGW